MLASTRAGFGLILEPSLNPYISVGREWSEVLIFPLELVARCPGIACLLTARFFIDTGGRPRILRALLIQVVGSFVEVELPLAGLLFQYEVEGPETWIFQGFWGFFRFPIRG